MVTEIKRTRVDDSGESGLDEHKQYSILFPLVIVKIIIIILIVIALKGAVQDFLQSPHCTTNCIQHVHSSGQGTVVCKSCATCQALIIAACHVPHGTKRQLSY